MRPLIVGVDPGNTLAVAAIDFDGELQLLESKRHFTTSEVTEKILETGRPIVIASDKKSTPSKVEKLAASLGAEIFEPKKDISKQKKSDLGKGDNSHEVDASAAAFNAYNNLQRELKKVEKTENEKEVTQLEAAENYFFDRPISKEKEKIEPEPAKKEVDNEEKKVSRLRRRIERLESGIEVLKDEREEFKAEKKELEERLIVEKDKDRSEVLHSEELKKREGIIKEKNAEIKELEEKNSSLLNVLEEYRKALKHIYNGSELLPIVEEEIDEEMAVTRDQESVSENVFHVEEIKGIELKDFFVAEDVPEKDFGQILEEYRRKRQR